MRDPLPRWPSNLRRFSVGLALLVALGAPWGAVAAASGAAGGVVADGAGVSAARSGVTNQVNPTPQQAFDDGRGTTGTVLDSGNLTVTIDDDPDAGVIIWVEGPGPGPAVVKIDGFRILLTDGDLLHVRGGSMLSLSVTFGPAEIEAGTDLIILVEEETDAQIADNGNGTFSTANDGASLGAVVIQRSGMADTVLRPGENVTVAGGTGGGPSDADAYAQTVFGDPLPGGGFAQWNGPSIRIAEALAGFEDLILIVWLWTGSAWLSYAPDIPPGLNSNFLLTDSAILWVAGAS